MARRENALSLHAVWERVFTISTYYDRPRGGVANFNGAPHAFECEFSDEIDDYTDRYFLKPIDAELFGLVMEDWHIWLEWCRAFHRKEVDAKTHPALVRDPERDRLKAMIGERLVLNPSHAMVKTARFRGWDICYDGGEVEWGEVAPDS